MFLKKLQILTSNINHYVYGSHFAQRSFYVFALSASKQNVFGVEPVERLGEITSEESLGHIRCLETPRLPQQRGVDLIPPAAMRIRLVIV